MNSTPIHHRRNLYISLRCRIILDVIKYCDHIKRYEKIPPIGGVRLRLKVSRLHSNQRHHLAIDRSGYWDTHMGPHRGAHICTQLFKGGRGRVDMESWVDMHICSYACKHSNKGVGPEDYHNYPGINPHNVTTYKTSNVVEQWFQHCCIGAMAQVLTPKLAWGFCSKYLPSL